MYLVVIQSAVTALLGTTLRWQKLERSGHTSMATALVGPAFAVADKPPRGGVQR
jgi:hypothetical protein